MKICKRIALIAIMFILFATLNVYAGIVEVTSTVSSTQVKAGDTVTVTLNAKFGTGIEGIDATLDYDTTKLKLTNESALAASDFTSMSGTNDSTGDFKLSVLYTGSGAAPTEATFATLSFEVLDTVTANETLTIKLSEMEIGDSQDNWVELDDQTITLTVIEEQTPGDGDQTPDDGDQTPDDGDQTPGDGDQTPDDGDQTPDDGDQTPDDDTTADDDFNYAGLEDYAFIVIFAVAIVAIVIYKKVNEYSDIK